MPESEKNDAVCRALLNNKQGFVALALAPSEPVSPARWARFKVVVRRVWSLTLIPLILETLQFGECWFRSKKDALIHTNRKPRAEVRQIHADARLKELQGEKLAREIASEYTPSPRGLQLLTTEAAQDYVVRALKDVSRRRGLSVSIAKTAAGEEIVIIQAQTAQSLIKADDR